MKDGYIRTRWTTIQQWEVLFTTPVFPPLLISVPTATALLPRFFRPSSSVLSLLSNRTVKDHAACRLRRHCISLRGVFLSRPSLQIPTPAKDPITGVAPRTACRLRSIQRGLPQLHGAKEEGSRPTSPTGTTLSLMHGAWGLDSCLRAVIHCHTCGYGNGKFTTSAWVPTTSSWAADRHR